MFLSHLFYMAPKKAKQNRIKKKKTKHVYFYEDEDDIQKLREDQHEMKINYYPHISDFELRFGHTFFEIFLVALSIVLLIGLVFYLVEPTQQFADLRNTQRITDLNQLQDAISQFEIENGILQDNVNLRLPICPNKIEIGTESNRLDLSELLIPKYLIKMPYDPQKGSFEESGYTYCLEEEDRFRLDAIHAEKNRTIAIIR